MLLLLQSERKKDRENKKAIGMEGGKGARYIHHVSAVVPRRIAFSEVWVGECPFGCIRFSGLMVPTISL